jgi:DNA invertase Pin-like site-specific DNA recombinase
MTKGTKVVGYVRVSSREQADSRLSLEAQEAEIRRQADARDWTLVGIERDEGISGHKRERRDRLRRAQAFVTLGEADAVVVTRLDRATRSVVDLYALTSETPIVALDGSIDMTTASGKLVTGLLAVVAEFESSIASERTKAGLAAKVARGERLGRPSRLDPEVRLLILDLHDGGHGLSYKSIAAALNAEKIPTCSGYGQWRHETVRRFILDSGAEIEVGPDAN